MNVFVISGMSKDVSIQGVFPGTSPFLVALGVLLALLMVSPTELALFIPKTMR
jgi:TRAP-type C4-dicarboxylate transport system permease large subunit